MSHKRRTTSTHASSDSDSTLSRSGRLYDQSGAKRGCTSFESGADGPKLRRPTRTRSAVRLAPGSTRREPRHLPREVEIVPRGLGRLDGTLTRLLVAVELARVLHLRRNVRLSRITRRLPTEEGDDGARSTCQRFSRILPLLSTLEPMIT
ncbi:uncharacterized protein JCM15063_004240 [Sporobolomyces koalae]|uniref:uncharacterized protein n=1 Tax=Sporobolomyces koalae TaxID=500713 RepID=UPI0031808B74